MTLKDSIQRATNFFTYKQEKSKRVKIVEFPKRRIAPKIDEFVLAVESASSKIMQSRTLLYDHYQQTMMFDSHVAALISKRLENIEGKTLVLYDGENPVEEINYFLSSPKFREFMKDIVMTKFWGMNLFEFDEYEWREKKWFDYRLIPIKHVNPYEKEILTHQTDNVGTSIADDDSYMFVGDPDSLGLLLQVTLLSLYRRLGMFNYGKYVDLASENFMQLMQREFSDNQNVKHVQDQLSKRDGGGIISLPDGVELRSENQSSSQQNQLFEGYMQMLKDELAVLILGQNMTTSDGSSRSQAEVHQSEQRSKYDADELYILDVLNYEYIDKLPLWGFEITPTMHFKFEENISGADDVAQSALNGIQISSLQALLMSLANGQLPAESVRGMIKASFPSLPEEIIDAMINGLENFTPKQQNNDIPHQQ
jgi:hypothetical protein